jgi:REP-associated tyrosine transposase
LLTPHTEYLALGHHPPEREAAYRALFEAHLDEMTIAEIREATQKGWALGNNCFQDGIERLLQRRTRPLPRGGDHRSVAFHEDEG